MQALLLGSKEYPMGTADGSDPSPSGGMEIYVNGLVPVLAKNGIGITVVTRKFSGTKSDEVSGNVRTVRVPFVSGFLLRNPSFNLMAFLRSLTLDFDVMISNGEVSNFFGLLLSKIKRRPIITVSHGLASKQPQYGRPIRAMFRLCDRLTYPNADAVITHAPWQMRGITEKYNVIMPGFDRSRLRHASTTEARTLRRRYAPNGEKVIVYTGRLIGVKGVDFLIRSLGGVRQKHVCIIVGDGPDMEKCRAIASAAGAKVAFTGFRSDVARFLSIADVFVMPSFFESLNYSLVEAAYMGVPIVCSDIGIIARNAAVLVKAGDEKSIASGISSALSKPDRARVAKARAYALGFSWDNAAQSYLKIIRGLVK